MEGIEVLPIWLPLQTAFMLYMFWRKDRFGKAPRG